MNTLFVSDLDGTLLRNDASLSDSSKSELRQLISEGLVFTVASARSVVSMQTILNELVLKLPVIEFNGAFISDLETGRHEIVNAIQPDVVQEVFACIQAYSCTPFVSTFNGTRDRLYYADHSNEGERFYVANRREHDDHRLEHSHDLAETLDEQVVCLTVIGEAEALAELELVIAEGFGNLVEIHLFENQYSPGWYWLTIHDRRATKDQAIRLLASTYGLSNHQLVVFGDHINDIKMFQIASHAVAVSNAHPEAKAYASHVIGSNEDDSVVEYIRYNCSQRTT